MQNPAVRLAIVSTTNAIPSAAARPTGGLLPARIPISAADPPIAP